MMDLPEAPDNSTDGFGNFLLEYKEKELVDKIVNCVARQRVNITAHLKGAMPPSMRENLVDLAQVEKESLIAAELMKIDPAQQLEEFQKLIMRVFAMYGQLTDEEMMRQRRRSTGQISCSSFV